MSELFRIIAAEGGYMALREASPAFALWGETPLQAYDCAIRALALAQKIAANRDAPLPGSGVV